MPGAPSSFLFLDNLLLLVRHLLLEAMHLFLIASLFLDVIQLSKLDFQDVSIGHHSQVLPSATATDNFAFGWPIGAS